ncbi:DUF3710 domain-containing protein [Cellulomonas sp. NPDC089187]|uniref:DUF3710 domain-containing protein n=1 Tax=Cellulomonas sp. NPDC089187 TaxID=3154970 RepID=UPI00343CB3BE
MAGDRRERYAQVALFRRGAKDRTAEQEIEPTEATDEVTEDSTTVEGDEDTGIVVPDRAAGPWDSTEDVPAGPRIDLGALRLPGIPGMALRMEIDKKTNTVTGVAVTLGESTLQMQAFAAPRTDGIWDEIREEIAASVTKQGGSVDDLPGPFGRELLARLPVRTPEGRTGHRPARFIGVDGPRWFLRGVVTGRAAVDPEAATAVEDLYRRTVVVRDGQARPPRDLLALTLPNQADGVQKAQPADGAEETPSFDPLTRGPEITEIR